MKIQCQFINSLDLISRQAWNRLIYKDFPFSRYEFLHALEQSTSVSKAAGWEPNHCIIYDQGLIVAIAPQYLKAHSYGEYVFDWSWADAYSHHGLQYYPKLVSSIPFTPCVGPRLLVDPAYDFKHLHTIYASACLKHCQERALSSWHILFPEEEVNSELLQKRTGVQFHWYNRDYQDFGAFLAALNSRKRKSIKKERTKVAQQNVEFIWREGAEASEQELKAFYACYQSTYLKRGQQGYLNWHFFELLFKGMPEAVSLLLVVQRSEDESRIVASSLFLKGQKTLYGRYWGCLEHYEHLHFEACYYQGIEYCIAHGLSHFDAGAQGEHKLLRGFEPIETRSYHWLAHPEFSQAVGEFLSREREQVENYRLETRTLLPYKKAEY